MKILYGVCGERFGHSSRALEVGRYLKKKGHKVHMLASDCSYEVLKNEFKTTKIDKCGLIVKEDGINMDYFKTGMSNAVAIMKSLKNWNKYQDIMKKFNPDVLINDMEPRISMLGNEFKKPVISIDNHHMFTNLDIDVPKKYKKDYWLLRRCVHLYNFNIDKSIICSFVPLKVNPKKKSKTIVVPAIIKQEIKNIKPFYGKKVLVYLSKQNKNAINVLKEIDEKFVVFGYDVNKDEDNIEFRTSRDWVKELASCKAVIGTGGFTLMAESKYLKKPYLAIPLNNFEQIFNSMCLKKNKIGDYIVGEIKKRHIKKFLRNLNKYKVSRINDKFDKIDSFKVIEDVIKSYK